MPRRGSYEKIRMLTQLIFQPITFSLLEKITNITKYYFRPERNGCHLGSTVTICPFIRNVNCDYRKQKFCKIHSKTTSLRTHNFREDEYNTSSDACRRFSIKDNTLGQRDNWNAVRGWECGEAAPILNHGEATSQSQSYVERSNTQGTLPPLASRAGSPSSNSTLFIALRLSPGERRFNGVYQSTFPSHLKRKNTAVSPEIFHRRKRPKKEVALCF